VNAIEVHVNGELVTVAADGTIAAVVAQITESSDPKGIAVAVDRCVIPRSEWDSTPVRAGTRIEVVTAAAGG
jgi:sulfur carrier protein